MYVAALRGCFVVSVKPTLIGCHRREMLKFFLCNVDGRLSADGPALDGEDGDGGSKDAPFFAMKPAVGKRGAAGSTSAMDAAGFVDDGLDQEQEEYDDSAYLSEIRHPEEVRQRCCSVIVWGVWYPEPGGVVIVHRDRDAQFAPSTSSSEEVLPRICGRVGNTSHLYTLGTPAPLSLSSTLSSDRGVRILLSRFSHRTLQTTSS